METKRCYMCGEHKPLDQFHRDKNSKDGHQRRCKSCNTIQARGYNYQYEQERRKRDPEYNEKWLEYKRGKSREWQRQHPEDTQERARRNAQKKATDPALRAKYTDYERARRQERQRTDSDFHQHLMTLAKEGQSRRRARIAGGGGSHTEAQWDQLCVKYDHRCLRCGEQKPLTEDHVIPITSGGSDDISNIQCLCGPCNSWKHTKTIDFR